VIGLVIHSAASGSALVRARAPTAVVFKFIESTAWLIRCAHTAAQRH
jgi:hypothetical protein